MNAPTSALLAPSVIKSLAKDLRKHPLTPSMSAAQSLEHMSHILGFSSWHNAQQMYKNNQITAQTVFTQASFRRNFYVDLEMALDAKCDLYDIIKTMHAGATMVNDLNRKVVSEYVVRELNNNKSMSQIVAQLNPIIPFEVLAIQSGERSGNLSLGFKHAQEFIV